jgi:hypothetical protein
MVGRDLREAVDVSLPCSGHAAAVSAGPVIVPRRSGAFGRVAGTRPPAGAHLSCMPGQPT